MSMLVRARRVARGGGYGGVQQSVDALLQSFLDGDYDGGTLTFYNIEFPEDAAPELVFATAAVASPAVASTVSPTDLVLGFVANPAVGIRSGPSTHKTAILAKPGGGGEVALSAGDADSDFAPDIMLTAPDGVDPLDLYPGDELDLDGVVHVQSLDDPVDHYSVPTSTTTPLEEAAYTAAFQAKDAGDVDVDCIGCVITPSITTVSGSESGSVTESSVSTNRYGRSKTVHALAGRNPTIDRVHGVDAQGKTGDSANIIVPPPVFYFNLRTTLAYITDPAGTVGVESADVYPTVRSGKTFGMDSATPSSRDRLNTNPAQLAGMHFDESNAAWVFKVDLTPFGGAGVYNIGLAFGEPNVPTDGPIRFVIKDNTTVRHTVDGAASTSGANKFLDATLTQHLTPAAWIANQTPLELTFASSVLRIEFGAATGTPGQTKVNCVAVQKVS